MKLLVITGMPGSGKEEFVDVSRQMGFDVVRMGDVVRMEASRRGIPLDDRSVGRFAHSERETHGYDVWAKRTVPFIKKEMTVIDGCRGGAELDVFKTVFGKDVTVVAIHAPASVRYERLRTRNRKDAPEDWKQFSERDDRELGWGLGTLISLADQMIVNEGTLEEFRTHAEELLREHGGHKIQGR